MKHYKAEYEDDEFELIDADSDSKAFFTAEDYEDEHGCLFNLFEIDNNYDEIRTVF